MDTAFSGWLIEQMQARNLSQSDLARASGLTRQAISYYLSEKSKSPDGDALTKIAHALHVSPIVVFRKAGLLPPGPNNEIKFEDWKFLLDQLTPEEEQEMREIAIRKIERHKQSNSLRSLKPKKAGK